MTIRHGTQFDELVITDIDIMDVADLPSTYFLRESVISALRAEVRRDVLTYHKPVPPGARPVFREPKKIKILPGVKQTDQNWSFILLAAVICAVAIAGTIIFLRS